MTDRPWLQLARVSEWNECLLRGPIPTPALSAFGAVVCRGELGRLSVRGSGGGGICVDTRRSEMAVGGAACTANDIVAEFEVRGVRGERGTVLMSGAIGQGVRSSFTAA